MRLRWQSGGLEEEEELKDWREKKNTALAQLPGRGNRAMEREGGESGGGGLEGEGEEQEQSEGERGGERDGKVVAPREAGGAGQEDKRGGCQGSGHVRCTHQASPMPGPSLLGLVSIPHPSHNRLVLPIKTIGSISVFRHCPTPCMVCIMAQLSFFRRSHKPIPVLLADSQGHITTTSAQGKASVGKICSHFFEP